MNTQTKRTISRILVGLLLTSGMPILASELPIAVDTAYFRSGPGKTRVEVYLGYDRADLSYRKTRRGQTAELATVVVVKQKRQVVDYKEFNIKDVRSQDEVPAGIISRQASFALVPGTYELHIAAEEKAGKRADEVQHIDVPSFAGHLVEMSSGQAGSLIRRTMGPAEFQKKGLYVIPHAKLRFDQRSDLVWYYTETYGLTPLDTATIYTEVYQGDSLAATWGPKHTPSPSHTLVHWGALNPELVSTGENTMRIRVIAAGDTVQTAMTFTVAAEEDTAVHDTAMTDTTEVPISLPEMEMTNLAGGLSLLTDLNLRQYRAGDESAKQQMILDAVREAWEQRGGDTTLAIDELNANWEFTRSYDRYQLGQRRLSAQGRVLFLHGRPDLIETYPATNTHREYQVWEYSSGDSIQQAIFLDREGYGEFTLEHASLPGGKQNLNWRNQLPRGAKPEPPPPTPETVEEVVEPIPVEEAEEQVETEGIPADEVPPTETIQDSVVTETVLPDSLPPSAPADTVLTEPAVEDTLQTP